MKNNKRLPLPSLAELSMLVKAIKREISPEFRAFEEDETPGILLTVGADSRGRWSWQTGDNSFSGGAYGFPYWGVAGIYKRSNARETAKEIQDQIAESVCEEVAAKEREDARVMRAAGL